MEIETTRAVPMQVDGEPLMMNPSNITIEYLNSAIMLTKKKSSCKLLQFYTDAQLHNKFL